jgi:hypothetical protein
MYVIGIEQFHNKPALRQILESFSRVVEFFEGNHWSVDLRKYRQPCIMSSIMRWIDCDASGLVTLLSIMQWI